VAINGGLQQFLSFYDTPNSLFELVVKHIALRYFRDPVIREDLKHLLPSELYYECEGYYLYDKEKRETIKMGYLSKAGGAIK